MKNRRWLLLCVILLAGAFGTHAQTADCPPNLVCITRDAALKAIADGDKVVAQAAEIKVKDQAIDDLKAELNKMRVEFAEKSGEATALKENDVANRAIIQLLVQNTKARNRIGLINF
jgi:hypothetical protein